jgi:hypothetical protein
MLMLGTGLKMKLALNRFGNVFNAGGQVAPGMHRTRNVPIQSRCRAINLNWAVGISALQG